MKNNFKDGRNEFKNKNYRKALEHFDRIGEGDEDYEYSLVYRIGCLIELKEYSDALKIINPLIEKNPYDELLWFDKATCHIFLNEDEKAFKAMNEIERIIDSGDKMRLVYVAKFYNMLGDYQKAIQYCDRALDIDECLREALHEKSLAGIHLDDADIIDSVADRLLELSDNDILSLTPVFLLRLFSKNYRGCLDLVENSDEDNVKEDTLKLFKAIIYNRICDDLNVRIMLDREIDMSVDEALKVMFDFIDSGCDHGEVQGVSYMIF